MSKHYSDGYPAYGKRIGLQHHTADLDLAQTELQAKP